MSRHRIDPRAGFAHQSKLPKGPNGRNLCRECGVEVPKGRLTFCSAPCIETWKIRSNPSHARKRVYERDHGICAMCAINTEIERAKRHEVRRLMMWLARRHFDDIDWRDAMGNHLKAEKAVNEDLKRTGWPLTTKRSWWAADHVVPVVEGGGGCDLSGLRTLCIICHLKVTRELHGRLKAARKSTKQSATSS